MEDIVETTVFLDTKTPIPEDVKKDEVIELITQTLTNLQIRGHFTLTLRSSNDTELEPEEIAVITKAGDEVHTLVRPEHGCVCYCIITGDAGTVDELYKKLATTPCRRNSR
jgi:hypothetical protein